MRKSNTSHSCSLKVTASSTRPRFLTEILSNIEGRTEVSGHTINLSFVVRASASHCLRVVFSASLIDSTCWSINLTTGTNSATHLARQLA